MVKHIHEFCVGKPQCVTSSHSGNVDLSVSFQESSVFLPTGPPRDAGEWTTEDVDTGRTNSDSGNNSPQGERSSSNTQTDDLPSYEGEQEAIGSVLRGSVIVKLQKPTKIRSLSLDLYGISRTFWNLVPQPGILGDTPLPSNAEIEDVTYFGVHHWDFIHCDQLKQVSGSYTKNCEGVNSTLVATDLYGASAMATRGHSQVEEVTKSFTIQSTNREGVPIMTPLKQTVKKIKQITPKTDGMTYPAGEYVYHFSIIIHRDCPESVNVPNGSIRYVLVPKIVRVGALNPNITGTTDIEVVRAPLTSAGMLVYNPASLSRIWDDRLEYSISLPQRYITLDVPSSLTLSLMSLPDSQVMVHQVRIYLVESVRYFYSPDMSIQASDSSLKLVLFQQNASVETHGDMRAVGSLLTSPEPMHLDCQFLVATKSNKPIYEIPQMYGRGKLGEKRFVEPDHTSSYVTVRHRLIITLRVSKLEEDNKRHHFEIKVDTPISILSKNCVHDNIYLPQYHDTGMAMIESSQGSDEPDGQLPTFTESMHHEVVGQGVRRQSNVSRVSRASRTSQPAPYHDTKFSVVSSKTPEATDSSEDTPYFDSGDADPDHGPAP